MCHASTSSTLRPIPMPKVLDDENEFEEEEEEEEKLTSADKKMLGKLVLFAKEKLGKNITTTGQKIRGRWVSYPEFQQVVYELGGCEEVTDNDLWKVVAQNLRYPSVARYNDVAEKLCECYEEALEKFDDFCDQVKEEKKRRASLGIHGSQTVGDGDSGVALAQMQATHVSTSGSRKPPSNISADASPVDISDTFKPFRMDREGNGTEISLQVPGTPEHVYNSSFVVCKEPSVVTDSQVVDLAQAESEQSEAFQPITQPLSKKFRAVSRPETVIEPLMQESSFLSEGSPTQKSPTDMVSVPPEVHSRKRSLSAMLGQDNQAELETKEYFAMCSAEGYAEEVAHEALHFANMNQDLAKTIWGRVAKGQDIPENIRGIWTPKDDAILAKKLPAKHTEMANLIRKHTREEVRDRAEYFERTAEAQ